MGCKAIQTELHPSLRKQDTHLSKMEVTVLEIVSQQRGALVDGDVVPNVDQVEVGEVQAVQISILAYPGTLNAFITS